MKIILPAALAAATLVLTVALPASADPDPGTRQTGQTGQKSAPSSVTDSGNSSPTAIDTEADPDAEGLLASLVGRVL
ncbi:hypothetical protein [Streptomyces sp. NPDC047043]|uniref:hypothetical protein n=1 Tax=Streptomyces sp. NPDC047043 TaxID=3154497 RepID=UPI0033CEC060